MPLAKIFYASLTGNTEEIADIVAESLEDLDFDVEIEECSNVSASDFEDADPAGWAGSKRRAPHLNGQPG